MTVFSVLTFAFVWYKPVNLDVFTYLSCVLQRDLVKTVFVST